MFLMMVLSLVMMASAMEESTEEIKRMQSPEFSEEGTEKTLVGSEITSLKSTDNTDDNASGETGISSIATAASTESALKLIQVQGEKDSSIPTMAVAKEDSSQETTQPSIPSREGVSSVSPSDVHGSSKVGTCEQAMVVGRCRGHFAMWWYNSTARACEDFIYGGCGGNENRFDSQQICEATCPDEVICPQDPSKVCYVSQTACKNATCSGYPEAVCRVTPCSCDTHFENNNGDHLTCQIGESNLELLHLSPSAGREEDSTGNVLTDISGMVSEFSTEVNANKGIENSQQTETPYTKNRELKLWGGVAGLLVVLLFLFICIFCYCKKRRNRSYDAMTLSTSFVASTSSRSSTSSSSPKSQEVPLTTTSEKYTGYSSVEV